MPERFGLQSGHAENTGKTVVGVYVVVCRVGDEALLQHSIFFGGR